MSYLNSFRINFYGGCTTNVSTANNAYFKGYVDPVETMVTGEFASMTDDEVIQALRSDYSLLGISQGGPLAGWNYYGNHFTPFQDAKIASAGLPGAVTESIGLADAPITLLGSKDPEDPQRPAGSPVMVDQDPTGGVGTQIFVGGFQIGSEGDIKLKVVHDTVCYSYFLGTRTPCASSGAGGTNACAMWQLHFPASAIESFDENDPDIAQIVADAQAADGLVMRFSTFEMGAVLGGQELLDRFANGDNPVNEALGYVVGTIGVHQESEFETCPPGRLLNPVPLYTRLGSPGLAESVTLGGTTYASLDLINVIPKIPRPNIADISTLGPNDDIGPLELVAGSTIIGPVDYRPRDYFKFGGIVDVPVASGDIQTLNSSALKIRGTDDNAGTVIVQEQEIRICSDDRVTYLDGEKTCAIRVTEFGGPPQQDITLNLATASSSFFPPTYPDPKNLTHPDSLTVPVDSGGNISFSVSETGPGMCLLNITPSGIGQGTYFMNFRVYPDDDYSAVIKSGNIQWDFVYEQVLRYYYVLFPAMSEVFPLNSEETVKRNGPGIIKRTSYEYRDTTLYMPITRAMSPGKRALLVAFLEQE